MRRSVIVTSAKRFAQFQHALAALNPLRHPSASRPTSSAGSPSPTGTSSSDDSVAPAASSTSQSRPYHSESTPRDADKLTYPNHVECAVSPQLDSDRARRFQEPTAASSSDIPTRIMRPRALVPSLLNNVIELTCSAALIVMCIPGQVVQILIDFASAVDDAMILVYSILALVVLYVAYKIYNYFDSWSEWVQGRPAYFSEKMEVKRERVRARVSDAQEWMSAKKESVLSAAAGFQSSRS